MTVAVTVAKNNRNEFWVQKVSDQTVLKEMKKDLGRHQDRKVEPTPNEIYAFSMNNKNW